jgi:hypothetical protein
MSQNNKRLNYVSILGFGDALVSLSMLQQVFPEPQQIRILGSSITAQIQTAIVGSQYELVEITQAHAKTFSIRTSGLGDILNEVYQVRRWSRQKLSGRDVVFFESPSLRNKILFSGMGTKLISPQRTDSAYRDRAKMLESYTGKSIYFPDCPLPEKRPESVLINPSARDPARAISLPVLHNLRTYFQDRNVNIALMDPGATYQTLATQFDEYYGPSDLATAAANLRRHQLYIGPDSLFTHLAYYYRIPSLTLVNVNPDFYFAPPGTKQQGNYFSEADLLDAMQLPAKLDRFLHLS